MAPLAAVFQSALKAISAEELWAQSTQLASVNREMFPIQLVPLGGGKRRPLGPTSTLHDIALSADERYPFLITLFGVIPLDVHKMGFDSLPVGQLAFIERSSNFFLAEWRHQRRILVEDTAVRVIDELSMTPRLAFLGPLIAWVYRLVFARRHKYLRRTYRGSAA